MAITLETLELIDEEIKSHKNPQIKEVHGVFDSEDLMLLTLVGFKRPSPLRNYLIGYFAWQNERIFKFMYNLKDNCLENLTEIETVEKHGETMLHTVEPPRPFHTPDALDVNTTSEWIRKNGTPEDKALRYLTDRIWTYRYDLARNEK